MRRPVCTFGFRGWAGGKAGFDPALLSSVLHGGSQICCHRCSKSRRQLKSACFHRGVRGRWHCCFSSPASVSLFSLCRKSQVHFSILTPLLLRDFTPFSVIRSIRTRARCCSAGVPRCEHLLLGSSASTPLLASHQTHS